MQVFFCEWVHPSFARQGINFNRKWKPEIEFPRQGIDLYPQIH
jgi:hypothetical protein